MNVLGRRRSFRDDAFVGTPVTFRNTSTAPGGEIGHVLWDFGAGVPTSESSPSFAYEAPDVCRITLVV